MIKVHLPVAETLPRNSSSSNVVGINGGRGVIFAVVSLVTPRDLRGILALSRAYFEALPAPGRCHIFHGLIAPAWVLYKWPGIT